MNALLICPDVHARWVAHTLLRTLGRLYGVRLKRANPLLLQERDRLTLEVDKALKDRMGRLAHPI
jgi:hypothetical protein